MGKIWRGLIGIRVGGFLKRGGVGGIRGGGFWGAASQGGFRPRPFPRGRWFGPSSRARPPGYHRAMSAPNFRDVLNAEEAVLAARLSAVRAAIQHAGEKGRGLEHHAIELLRAMLPREYGVATGFVAHAITAVGQTSRVELSPQTDALIFDAVRGAPIVDLGSSQVIAIESVFAGLEVKASFDRHADEVATWSAALRRMTLRHYVFHEDRDDDPVAEGRELVDRCHAAAGGGDGADGWRANISPDQRRMWPPPLTFALAFEYGREHVPPLDALRARLAKAVGPDGHIDGLLIPGVCTLWSDGEGGIEGTSTHTLAAWRYRLVSALSSFRRPGHAMTPDLRPYFTDFVVEEPGIPTIAPRW